MKLTVLFTSALLATSLIACGGEEEATHTPADTTHSEAPPAPETPAPAAEEAASPEMMNGVQVITVNVQDTGYIPSRIKFKAGVPAKIIFDQHGTTKCAWDVKSPDLGIKLTEIPKDKKTEVSFTPDKSGTFAFTCGMDMMRGSIIVEEGTSM